MSLSSSFKKFLAMTTMAVGFALAANPAQATTIETTIDFDNIETNGTTQLATPYTEDGFVITGPDILWITSSNTALPSPSGTVHLAREDGSLFDWFSIDLSGLFMNQDTIAIVQGTKEDSSGSTSTVTETFFVEANPEHALKTFTATEDFTNMQDIYWTVMNAATDRITLHAVDNIRVSYDNGIIIDPNEDDNTTVPEPSTIILYGIGVSSIAFIARRREEENNTSNNNAGPTPTVA